MNRSKKFVACTILILALFTVNSTYAQGGRGMDTAAMRQRQEAMLAKMRSDLNLTQVQYDSVKAITTEFNAKRREIFMDPANQGLSREDRMARMQPLNDAMHTRLQAALGADLFKKYQEWMQEWMQQNRPQRPN